MVILDPDLDDRAVAPTLDRFLQVVTERGGVVDNVAVWGRRRMAYEIKKQVEGLYAVIDITAAPEVVGELDRQLRLNEDVLRIKVIRPELH